MMIRICHGIREIVVEKIEPQVNCRESIDGSGEDVEENSNKNEDKCDYVLKLHKVITEGSIFRKEENQGPVWHVLIKIYSDKS